MLVSLFIVFFTIRLPPSSTRTYPLFPDTTPFRSCRDRTARPQRPRCAGKSGARLSLFGIARRRHRLRAPADRPWGQARRPRGAGGGNGGRFRAIVLRHRLCGRLAGAAAAADQLRRQGKLYRPVESPVVELRPDAVPLPQGIGGAGGGIRPPENGRNSRLRGFTPLGGRALR